MGGFPIVAGERFGSLSAVSMQHKVSNSGRKRAHWVCACDCGGEIVVDGGNLRNGNTRWCRACSARYKSEYKTKHGHSKDGKPTKAYQTWKGIKRRIFNPNDKRYPDYGGRGLDMSPVWRDSFEVFLADMGEPPSKRHQIDRIDNDKGYWPENCRWADLYEQGANKRNNVIIEWQGRKQTLAEWCRETGVSYDTAKRRVLTGTTDPAMILYKGRKPYGQA
tara:strand:- start:1793 stop:2452 length:660 start_codon:yes stop_codon:yes gene_type:complete